MPTKLVNLNTNMCQYYILSDMTRAERQNPVEQINALERANDCLSCRIIGASALGGTGAYAIWQSRTAAPGSIGQKRVLAGLGLGTFAIDTLFTHANSYAALFIGSIFRWRH